MEVEIVSDKFMRKFRIPFFRDIEEQDKKQLGSYLVNKS